MKDKNLSLLAKWVWRFGNEDSSLWRRAVNSLFANGSVSGSILREGLKFVVGDGKRVDFWSELGREEAPLKNSFPRILALSVKKSGPVQELNQFKPRTLFKDAIAWSYSPKGLFSVNYFHRCLEDSGLESSKGDASLVWQGICPLKVEVFVW
ncbi:hypothetical protein LWI29_036147 [Acer saccharum]|uniref:Reverse transcriptase zinc-binding domain-containing protein n=1 Tax=Acer saccharum TaxID=4024 RepID=A0AA39T114_ACESA|nr:hypothetical protein LWI29_036147 [Acer saccharum]